MVTEQEVQGVIYSLAYAWGTDRLPQDALKVLEETTKKGEGAVEELARKIAERREAQGDIVDAPGDAWKTFVAMVRGQPIEVIHRSLW